MSIKELTKSGPFILALLVAVVAGLPFGIEQIGEASGLFAFPATKWVKDFFTSKSEAEGAKVINNSALEKQIQDLEIFQKWAEGRATVNITIVRPDEFQVVRADPNPATASHFSWKLLLLSDKLDVNATQIRNKLVLICEPADKVSGRMASVKPLAGKEKGFLVTVDSVRGEGKMGLSYEGMTPVYYDVKLRSLWLVPVASCRSAMKDRYDAAAFFPGMETGLSEGAVISPGDDKCGYRILSISDRCVWFEAFYGNEPLEDTLPHSIWPDFSRVDTMSPTPPPGRLIFGKSRCFWPGDAIKLPNSGSYLMVDDFLAGRAVIFRLLDAAMRPIRELLCVIVREK